MKLSSTAVSTVAAFLAASPVITAQDASPRSLRVDNKIPGRGTPQSSIPTIDLSTPGAPLLQPKIISSSGNTLKATLRLNVAKYIGPAFNSLVRVHNGAIPGPCFRVKPGGRFHLTLVNDLDGPTGLLQNNNFQHPNHTNNHLHGIHISAENASDLVFVKVEQSEFPGYKQNPDGKNVGPREFHNYRYEFDGNLMPGTFWYHPHLHGSTALQASIVSGLVIMEDPINYPIPDIIRNMPEVLMQIYNLDLGTGVHGEPGSLESGGLREWSRVSGDRLSNWTEDDGYTGFEWTDEGFNGGDTNVFLPNFQYQPVVTMLRNKWYRFRIAHTVTEASLVMGLENNDNCEMKLIAKDGIYIKNSGVYGPRDIMGIILSPGNRADVAIRCSDSENILQLSRAYPSSDISAGSDFDPLLGADPVKPTVFSIEVVDNPDDDDDDLPSSYDLPTPCYLVNTLTSEVPEENELVVDYEGRTSSTSNPAMGIVRPGRVMPQPNGDGTFPYGQEGPEPENVIPWINDRTPFLNLMLGELYDLVLGTGGVHPHHQHVNSFQLRELEQIPGYDAMSDITKTYFQNGDWHDVFQWPQLSTGGHATYPIGPPCCCSGCGDDDQLCQLICVPLDTPGCIEGSPLGLNDTQTCGALVGSPIKVKVRFPLNQFAGRMVFHCHRLNHEDLGMIGFFQVKGNEGTLWDGAREVDPQCLLPKLPGNV